MSFLPTSSCLLRAQQLLMRVLGSRVTLPHEPWYPAWWFVDRPRKACAYRVSCRALKMTLTTLTSSCGISFTFGSHVWTSESRLRYGLSLSRVSGSMTDAFLRHTKKEKWGTKVQPITLRYTYTLRLAWVSAVRKV